ncbi:EAL domain-containing protein [Azospirillum sp. SYSU D00513]|uniref:EAL domain-containing protein n=1 Tax=Azospirillum sp. SYSU D00513 TaxID=2812561 RepID=UPI001A96828C|nr:EAL domain-containing protein [Azospirillum sp. SYSU D00513]
MTLLTHLVYALAYLIAGLSVGATLPAMRPAMDPLVGWLAGAVVVLAGGLLHEMATRLDRERTVRRRMGQLLDTVEMLEGEVARHKAILDQLTRAGAAPGANPGANPSYETMVQEVKLLQSLVGQLTERRATAEARHRHPAEPRVAEPAMQAPAARRAPLISRPAPRGIPDDNAPPLDDDTVLEAVRDALKADRIDIYLQPIVSLPQRKHRFYEVFSRVRAADGHQIMPDRYLQIAEREGLIATVDNLLLVRCIQLIRETERRQHSIGFFSNISAATLSDADFMRQFLHLMAQNQPLVPKLVFEMSQQDLREGGAVTMGILSQLARLGFRFSMDQVSDPDLDVDALLRHEFRYVKLDRGLLADTAMAPRVEALRRALDGHPIDIIVEKIETEAQLIDVLDTGFDFGQGYLFGEPRLSRKPA